jgi:hypothetical protein
MKRLSSVLVLVCWFISTTLPTTAINSSILADKNPAAVENNGLTQDEIQPALAQPARLLDRFGGSLSKTIIYQGFAYLSEGSDLISIDLSNPEHPRITSRIQLAGDFLSAAAIGAHLYMVVGHELSSFLFVFDISIPSQPVQVAELPQDGYYFLKTDGRYLYRIYSNGLEVLDISDPLHPLVIGEYFSPLPAATLKPSGMEADTSWPQTDRFALVVIQDDYAYIGYNVEGGFREPVIAWGLNIISLQDPRNPVLVNTTKIEGGYLTDMVVTSRYIYIYGEYLRRDIYTGNTDLTVWDRSNPREPSLVGVCDDCLTGTVTDMEIYGNTLYFVNFGGPVPVMDVSNPNQPVRVNTAWIKGYYIAVGDGVAVVNDNDLWTVLDLGSPHYPLEIGTIGFPGEVQDLEAGEGKVFVVSGGCLKIYEFGRHEQSLGRLCQGIEKIEKKDNIIFARSVDKFWYPGQPGGPSNILAIDVSNPYLPSVISVYPHEQDQLDMKLFGDLLFLSDGKILDVSDPALPSLIASIILPGENLYIDLIDVWESYAIIRKREFLSDISREILYVVDISDPSRPVIASSTEVLEYSGMAVAQGYLYRLVRDSTFKTNLQIFQLTGDGQLVERGRYIPAGGMGGHIFADNGYLFAIADRDCIGFDCNLVLQALNLSDPTQPILAGAVTLDESLYRIVFSKGLIYGIGSTKLEVYLFQFGWRVSGTVVDVSGRPFGGIRVAADQAASATSDTRGRYQVSYLDQGAHILTAEKEGYAFWPISKTVQLTADLPGQNFYILPAPLSGQLSSLVDTLFSYTGTNGRATSITFPAGAWDGLQAEIEPFAFFGSQGLGHTGQAFELRVEGLEELPAPVIATLLYTDFDVRNISNESQLDLYWWNGLKWVKSWQVCPIGTESRLDQQQNQLAANLCRVGRYALLGPSYQFRLPLVVP